MTHRAPVLVVGAGPVGLSAAALLGRRGIECTVIERRAPGHTHPKARGVRIRTMELFRQWGLEPALRAHQLPGLTSGFIYCESLAGNEYARSAALEHDEGRFSPTSSCRVPQYLVEDELLRAVQRFPSVRVRHQVELMELVQHAEGVSAVVNDLAADETETIPADYVIAADGIGSLVRQQLDIDRTGPPVLAYWQSIYWRGNLDRWTADRPCIQFISVRNAGAVTVAPVDGGEHWVTMVTRPPSATPPEPLDVAAAQELITQAVGAVDVDAEILDIATWRLSAQVADTFARDRVFLAGDSAHVFPPTGGFGMNTGVQDVHNLVWKIDLVQQGRADPRLLETYTAERRPVAQANADWSVANSGRIRDIVGAITEGDQDRLTALITDQAQHVNSAAQDLGFSYAPEAPSTTQPHPDQQNAVSGDAVEFRPVAVSGRRAPHTWVIVSGVRLSILDLFDETFVLLAGTDGARWMAQATGLKDLALPVVRSYQFGTDILDASTEPTLAQLFRLDPTGAILVRPDGHIAWRTDHAPSSPAALHDQLIRIVR